MKILKDYAVLWGGVVLFLLCFKKHALRVGSSVISEGSILLLSNDLSFMVK